MEDCESHASVSFIVPAAGAVAGVISRSNEFFISDWVETRDVGVLKDCKSYACVSLIIPAAGAAAGVISRSNEFLQSDWVETNTICILFVLIHMVRGCTRFCTLYDFIFARLRI